MAKRRMFSTDIVESGAFTALPPAAQALYFHLGMTADDDGVVSNEKVAMLNAGAKPRDMEALLSARFLLRAGRVLVVKHWRKNNYIQSDRYTPSPWQDDLEGLHVKPDGTYTDHESAELKAFREAVGR